MKFEWSLEILLFFLILLTPVPVKPNFGLADMFYDLYDVLFLVGRLVKHGTRFISSEAL